MPAEPTLPCSCRRRCWRCWILLLLALGLGTGIALLTIHPYLAVTERVPAKILVIEGWLPDYAIEAGVEEFRAGGYERIFTTGGPLEKGSRLTEYQSHAGVAAGVLATLGFGTNQVTAVASGIRFRNRTLASAEALREFLATPTEAGTPRPAFNIVTLGSHARRTRLCFQRAFGSETQIGIIAIENREYDPQRWWSYSEGVKSVLAECLGLAYAWSTLDYGS